MDSQHKAIRALLSSMAPKRAISYIQAFELPEDETNCLIECDVRGLSCIHTADKLHMSIEQVKRARKRAFSKIADQLNHE